MSVFIKRVSIENYKSIAKCVVDLHPFTILVGLNGAGKSNFLDALALVSESLQTSLEHALRERSGIKEVRRRSRGHPRYFGIRIEFVLPDEREGFYAFKIGTSHTHGFSVQKEECLIKPLYNNKPDNTGELFEDDTSCSLPKHLLETTHFLIENGKRKKGEKYYPQEIEPDRLYLPLVSAFPQFRSIYKMLAGMGFYNLSPDAIRKPQKPDEGKILARDGSNITSVINKLKRPELVELKKRMFHYLESIVPGISSVETKNLGSLETLVFRQKVAGDNNDWRFYAGNISDGTLRTLGILVAAFQAHFRYEDRSVSLIGIEEPEIAIHPGAAVKIADALFEASERVQVIITTHSPDLLDHENIRKQPEHILCVSMEEGNTTISAVDEVSLGVIKDNLYSPGELLRMDQIESNRESFETSIEQLNLFDKDLS